MNISLNVPYAEKNSAKAQGAKWDPILKTWYITNIADLPKVEKWIEPCNVICENLYLLKMKQQCWNCGKETEVVQLATDKSYSTEEGYVVNNDIRIFSYVKDIPKKLEEFMQQHLYVYSYSHTIKEEYYVNHCKCCKQLQGDHFLQEIPQQSFYKKVFYKDCEPIRYAKINLTNCIPMQVSLPRYEECSASLELTFAHMFSGAENRASVHVTQKKINTLFQCSIRDEDIQITGL